jgi:phospholipase C
VEVRNPLYIGSHASLEHFVFIMKENRTFDHYFGKFPGVDGATQGEIHTGQVVPLTPAPDFQPHDIDHSREAENTAIDGGKMDGFDLISGGQDLSSYTQFDESGIPNYWAYARAFTLADHNFASMVGPSFPNHLYAIGAQGAGAVSNPIVTPAVPGTTVPVVGAATLRQGPRCPLWTQKAKSRHSIPVSASRLWVTC